MDIIEAYNVPEECISGFNMVNVGQNDPLQIYSAFGTHFCRPQCGNILIQYYKDCLPDPYGQQMIDLLVQLCSQNEQGTRCYSSSVVSALSTTFIECTDTVSNSTGQCSSRCQTAVQNTVATAGCCIHFLNMLGVNNATDILQVRCGISIPGGLCSGSTLGSGSAAPTVNILIGALAVMLSITLQGLVVTVA